MIRVEVFSHRLMTTVESGIPNLYIRRALSKVRFGKLSLL